ncbi:McrC family protein [Chryseobacterium taihuense]|uniref:5-methylcytosine-specific restriction enzyme subunit McrC n=1 Tax=Chryseobacterium taihuense TaxID=1141221 RepID=A0ABY0R391_9FLAO|nr:restriction endonuclease [Chryseobacterium taihuense]SDM33002.1 5-methylcytosine-specific restriction enzyme subunit McrC [Chryseobacterium taihuense]
MSKNKPIQVFEYQKLKIGQDGFTETHFQSLVLFNEKNSNKYFTAVHKGILFNCYVGVIQIGGLTIEILPKADSNDNKLIWRDVLLHMLKECKLIQVDNVSETHLKKKYNSVLEAYYDIYLNEIEYLIKRGLIKKYRKNQSNQLSLKGKLLFSQNIQKNLVHKERFYCSHQVYDRNNLIHQILLEGLSVLQHLETRGFTDRINRIMLEFDKIDKVKITPRHFAKIQTNRKTKPYTNAIQIARMLILNYSPNISSGNENMLTLLFDMNKLWEEYIFRILHKYKPATYKVSYQNSDNFWENKRIKPDILLTKEDGENFIIDTKWKITTSNKPSDEDLKQMFVYNLHWESPKSMLLYPQIDQKDSEFGNYKFKYNDRINQCKLGFVSILDSGRIKKGKQLCDEILSKIQ